MEEEQIHKKLGAALSNIDNQVNDSDNSNNENPLGFRLDQWAGILEQVKQDALGYLLRMKGQPVSIDPQLPLPEKLPLSDTGMGIEQVIKQFKENWTPHLVGASSSHYVGFVTGGVTPAALAGDWFTTVWDQNTQAVSGQGDVSARLEQVTIELVKELLGLPDAFMGGFVTGATMSNFTCLGTARQWWGAQKGINIAMDGITAHIPVLTATAHSSSIKCLSMLGIGSRNLIQVKITQGDREVMDMEDLAIKIKALDGAPFILISSAGTVNTVDFDDFNAINALKKTHNFWWHIDGAFGGFAACSPKYKHLVDGWQAADSITVDGHKWLNVPYDSGIFFIRKRHHLLSYETYRNSNAPYLGEVENGALLETMNFLNFLPENSRRFRALPAWFSLMSYGKKGYQQIVENSVERTRELSAWIEGQSKLMLVAPTRLNNICFTLRKQDDPKVEQFLYQLNKDGKVFMSPTLYRGKKAIRASFVNWQTSKEDIDFIKSALEKTLEQF
ncbi:pyridoxal-dependent decarboxylase [Arachidicoccus ginsenosidivorans]|nr:pyridoxal-dependent decarboxylase [Arachidicoccus ginsenosidivorans]